MLCSKLHGQKGVNLIPFSYKIDLGQFLSETLVKQVHLQSTSDLRAYYGRVLG